MKYEGGWKTKLRNIEKEKQKRLNKKNYKQQEEKGNNKRKRGKIKTK